MAEYDLTSTLLKYVDRHLGFPLLSHLSSTDLFNPQDIAQAQYELARGSESTSQSAAACISCEAPVGLQLTLPHRKLPVASMVDYMEHLHQEVFPGQETPKELEEQRRQALAQHESLGAEVETVLNIIEDPNVASALKQDKEKNLEWLRQNYDVRPASSLPIQSRPELIPSPLPRSLLQLTLEQLNVLYRYGYFHFSCGNYGQASSYLYHFRILSTDPVLTFSSQWGKLASDILTGEWERALEELKLIREQLDAPHSRTEDAEALLQKRTWLLHWSLFVFFNHPEGRQALVEMFLSLPYLNTIQTTSWWLLRHLVAALILTRRNSRVYLVPSPQGQGATGLLNANPIQKVTPAAALRDVSRIILSESEYRLRPDPIVDFVAKLYGDFDFEAAQEELKKAEKVAEADFFLQDHKDGLIEGARYLISEAYTRVHQRVDIADLSARLNLSREEGEKWIVNLIRDTRADAKIDFKEGIVSMNLSAAHHAPVYQTVIEQTRGFTFRTAAMGQAIDRKAHPGSNAVGDAAAGGPGGASGGRGGRGGRGGSRGGRGGNAGGRGGGASGRSQIQSSSAGSQQQQQSGDATQTMTLSAPPVNSTAEVSA